MRLLSKTATGVGLPTRTLSVEVGDGVVVRLDPDAGLREVAGAVGARAGDDVAA